MSKTLRELASELDAKLIGEPQCEITAVLPLDRANASSISFINDAKYLDQIVGSNAAALIIKPSFESSIPESYQGALLIVDDPYLAFARVSQILDPSPVPKPTISTAANISDTAKLGKNIHIGDFVSIAEGVVIADNCIIEAGAVIGANSQIGENSRIYSNATLYHGVEIGERCIIHANAVIGSDGFGYANDKGSWVKIPQVGTVIIGNDVEIGAHTAIDRGALDNTVIGSGVILDNHIHIAHNVHIGENTAIAGCTAIAGSTKIGANCTIAGRVSIIGHLDICDGVHLTACTFVNKSISKPGAYSSATTFQTNKDWQKSAVRFRQLDDMWRKLKALSKEITELRSKDTGNKEK
ncbi:MAG: UDP-3-O-(3-hydroxymyristoyl)glucosamine N-acyltransferase [Gammaproteobacteria bacterium]|nr:UDP-3-O-(3-hydroxymyristoyl)glucosamine N-acyltransferase [Gammaproteobacteria bacterium]